ARTARCTRNMRRSSWLSGFLRNRLRNRGADLRGGGLTSEIRRPHLPLRKYASDCWDDTVVSCMLAEVIEHHRAGPDRTDWIRDSLAGDVRRRTMHGLHHHTR